MYIGTSQLRFAFRSTIENSSDLSLKQISVGLNTSYFAAFYLRIDGVPLLSAAKVSIQTTFLTLLNCIHINSEDILPAYLRWINCSVGVTVFGKFFLLRRELVHLTGYFLTTGILLIVETGRIFLTVLREFE